MAGTFGEAGATFGQVGGTFGSLVAAPPPEWIRFEGSSITVRLNAEGGTATLAVRVEGGQPL